MICICICICKNILPLKNEAVNGHCFSQTVELCVSIFGGCKNYMFRLCIYIYIYLSVYPHTHTISLTVSYVDLNILGLLIIIVLF